MEIIEMKSYCKIKNSDELNNRVEMTEDQIRVLEDRSIKFTQSEQQTGKKEKERASRTHETITKELTLVSSESQKERRKCGTKKYSKK